MTLTPIPAQAGIRPGGPRMPDCAKDHGPTDGLFRPAAGSVVAPGGGALEFRPSGAGAPSRPDTATPGRGAPEPPATNPVQGE